MSSETDQDGAPGSQASGRPAARVLLWTLLVVFSAINITANTIADGSLLAGLPSAIVVIGCAAALVAHHRKHRHS